MTRRALTPAEEQSIAAWGSRVLPVTSTALLKRSLEWAEARTRLGPVKKAQVALLRAELAKREGTGGGPRA